MSNETFLNMIKSGDQTAVQAQLSTNPNLANSKSSEGLSAVLLAMYYGQPAIAKLIVAAGATLNIFEAAAVGASGRVRELVERQSELVNAVAPDGFQPLGLAAFFGHEDVAAYLVEQGAAVDAPSHNGQRVRPLHSATAGRHLTIVRLLLEHGADVNARQNSGFVPLHNAAQNGQTAMIELLLAHGADPSVAADDGRTAADFARENGHAAVVEQLER